CLAVRRGGGAGLVFGLVRVYHDVASYLRWRRAAGSCSPTPGARPPPASASPQFTLETILPWCDTHPVPWILSPGGRPEGPPVRRCGATPLSPRRPGFFFPPPPAAAAGPASADARSPASSRSNHSLTSGSAVVGMARRTAASRTLPTSGAAA